MTKQELVIKLWKLIKKLSPIIGRFILIIIKYIVFKIVKFIKFWYKVAIVSALAGALLAQGSMISDLKKSVQKQKNRIEDLESNWKLFEDMSDKKVDGVMTNTLKKVSDNKNLDKKMK
jgi:hypothetical protein